MTSPFAVVTDGLTKRFGDFTAVDHIDLEVEAGTVLSLLGPNGAGKTTTVRMLATLSAPTSGTARICGHDVGHRSRHRARPHLAHRPVRRPRGQPHRPREPRAHGPPARLRPGIRQPRGRPLVDRFDIGEFRDKLVKSVSGGQRRRVDLAAGLVHAAQPAGARRAHHRARPAQPPGGLVDRQRAGRRRRRPCCSPRSSSTKPTPSLTTSC